MVLEAPSKSRSKADKQILVKNEDAAEELLLCVLGAVQRIQGFVGRRLGRRGLEAGAEPHSLPSRALAERDGLSATSAK